MTPPPVKRQDHAIVRTDAQLTKEAAITEDDVLRARHWWPGVAPAGFEGLIEARAETPKGTT